MKENIMKAAVLSALLLIAAPAWAVNKCTVGGRTVYQDAPCADGGGAKVNLSGAGPSDADIAAVRGKAAALCETALRTIPAWKDADSLKVTNMTRMGHTTIKLHDTTLVAVQYRAMVNGKNSYGAYAGQTSAFCFLNETETKVLQVQTL